MKRFLCPKCGRLFQIRVMSSHDPKCRRCGAVAVAVRARKLPL